MNKILVYEDVIKIQKLSDLDIVKIKDGYSESEKELKKFEAKYNMTSKEFYDKMNKDIYSIRVSPDDVADWLFNCNIFISCGGKLK